MLIYITKRTLLILMPGILTLNMAAAQEAKKIDSYMQRAHQFGLFSGNIEVLEHNKVIYKKSLGFIDATKQVPLTDQYRFHIGSIAKEFSAVGIMMLKEQGKLNLEDKVSKYIAGLPAWSDMVSIKNLLQYTSGLPDLNWKTVNGDADNWKALQKLEKLDAEPGTHYAYNNNNNFLQKAIIAKVSGMAFNDFVQQNILIPAGMNASLVDPTDQDPLVAKSYNNNGKQDTMFYPITGWVAVTTDDFKKWSDVIAEYKLISPESTRKILYPFGPDEQAGLGHGTMEGNILKTHVHDGMNANYQALLDADFNKGRTIILLSNNKQNNVYTLNDALQAILDGKPYDMPVKSFLNENKKQLDTMSARQILSLFNTLKLEDPKEYGFNQSATLNEVGYYLLENGRITDATAIFKHNTLLFPKDGNVYDSLGEAYYKQGDKANAMINYKKSLKLSPDSQNAKNIIAKLEKSL